MSNLQAIDLLKGLEQSLDDYCELNDEGKTAFRMAIAALELFGNAEQLPSAQPEQQWISCKDRLPEVNESVLVTTEWNDISIAWRIGIDKWFIHEGNTNATTDDLAAWMPLPEPWRGEEQ